jgi:hypothetical protein
LSGNLRNYIFTFAGLQDALCSYVARSALGAAISGYINEPTRAVAVYVHAFIPQTNTNATRFAGL